MAFKVHFETQGKTAQCQPSMSLLECARHANIELNSVCDGKGTCHSCGIQLIEGTLSPVTVLEKKAFPREKTEDGWRLACQAHPRSDCRILVPRESLVSMQRTQTEGMEVTVPPDPVVKLFTLHVSEHPNTKVPSDDSRIISSLESEYKIPSPEVDIDVLRIFSAVIRDSHWDVKAAVRGNEIIDIMDKASSNIGLAIDLGSTKIAAYLVDMDTGHTLASEGMVNPQASYGADIISRLNRALKSKKEALKLQQIVVKAINEAAFALCATCGMKPDKVLEAVIVGNTAMHHLFLGLPVKQLALAPYVPAVSSALDIKARDCGLSLCPGAYVHFPPNIAGFIGSDHTAALITLKDIASRNSTLFIDIGTNTEVSLINKGLISSVSCASGPAFEGGHIKYGMRASEGAIEHILISADKVEYQTIGNVPPAGLCGSAVFDAAAHLYKANIIDSNGRFKKEHPRVRLNNGQYEFVIVTDKNSGKPAITFTQRDIREIQLAKAAIQAGIHVLLQHGNVALQDLKQVIVAGAFGSYINIQSAITIGMLPALPSDRFSQVGNAAGMGAKMILTSSERRNAAREIASNVHYIELGADHQFNEIFINSTYFGSYQKHSINGKGVN